MSVLVIGGDNICNIKEKLMETGFDKIHHISGRKKSDRKIRIPEKTDLVLVLVDYVGHSLTSIAKEESKKSDVKIVFSKRSWVHMENIIQDCAKEISDAKRRYNWI
ncbi:dihydroorotate dehydrogenase [Clostridium carboxidivorans P7]|uniref:Dihydroorotate dehydrogenase n=1 Tax=Clostridium carboxidivorans P7 TaxID=536227 RepID=C6PWX9_9CLOT|nr:DUF2325 domain-containing protein [Clostridium carboxidivorans]AKN32157.1 dihydroorotate dehydrogenase [Clostridium carboxidivorans P7]EET86285.1 conserved hypothetical protein [Clostridium carboxidivorans P7]